MELLVTKQGSSKLYRIVHGNKVKKAVGDDYLKKMPAGFDKEGNLYVYKKQPKSVKYKDIPIYETDYISACPKCGYPLLYPTGACMNKDCDYTTEVKIKESK